MQQLQTLGLKIKTACLISLYSVSSTPLNGHKSFLVYSSQRQESPPDLCQLAKERCDFPNPQKTSRDADAGYDWFNKRGDY